MTSVISPGSISRAKRFRPSASAILFNPFSVSFHDGLFAKVGYTYGESNNTVDAGSIASGSWTGNAIALDPNNPAAARSQFSPGPRIFGALTYSRDFLSVGATSVSLYFDARSAGSGSELRTCTAT